MSVIHVMTLRSGWPIDGVVHRPFHRPRDHSRSDIRSRRHLFQSPRERQLMSRQKLSKHCIGRAQMVARRLHHLRAGTARKAGTHFGNASPQCVTYFVTGVVNRMWCCQNALDVSRETVDRAGQKGRSRALPSHHQIRHFLT